jgi:hypothetical protein
MRPIVWTGRVLTVVAVLFLLFDGAAHIWQPGPVVDAMTRLDFPLNLSAGIGVLEIICVLIYAIPRTAVLGAVLLTGYLGGAVAIQMRAGSSFFETIFPVIMGVMVWAGILLRERRLWAFIPVRR